MKDYSIIEGTKIHLVVKKDNESNLTKELKSIGKTYVSDVDQFASVFNQVSQIFFVNDFIFLTTTIL